MIWVGDDAPLFCLANGDEQEICLKSYQGKWIVLYFYPKDNTSGCTHEAVEFTAAKKDLQNIGAEVIGISRDSPSSHKKFAEKHSLQVLLLSDQDHKITEAYGAWSLKRMYDKESYGVVRSTFLIDPQGRVAHTWRKVKVAGHVEAVIKTLRDLKDK